RLKRSLRGAIRAYELTAIWAIMKMTASQRVEKQSDERCPRESFQSLSLSIILIGSSFQKGGARCYNSVISIGGRFFHFPFVKSGKSTGRLRLATDSSESGKMTLQVTES